MIEPRILLLRGERVIIDSDLADPYGTTKVFNQAVKRNRGRFPEDFMFQLTVEEAKAVRSQFRPSVLWSQFVNSSPAAHGGGAICPTRGKTTGQKCAEPAFARSATLAYPTLHAS